MQTKKNKRLSKSFFNRPVLVVAKELLGKHLVRKINGKAHRFIITEVEAYDGEKDLACHAAKGRTKRTEVLYGEPGRWYVYLCYGMYWMLNVVTGPVGYPAAVLIRGIVGIRGPGRVTKSLMIDKSFNGRNAHEDLYIADSGITVQPSAIKKTPRIGVEYAGSWAAKKYRFILDLIPEEG